MAASGATSVTLASVDRQTAPTWAFRPPEDTRVIVRPLREFLPAAIEEGVPLQVALAKVVQAVSTEAHSGANRSTAVDFRAEMTAVIGLRSRGADRPCGRPDATPRPSRDWLALADPDELA